MLEPISPEMVENVHKIVCKYSALRYNNQQINIGGSWKNQCRTKKCKNRDMEVRQTIFTLLRNIPSWKVEVYQQFYGTSNTQQFIIFIMSTRKEPIMRKFLHGRKRWLQNTQWIIISLFNHYEHFMSSAAEVDTGALYKSKNNGTVIRLTLEDMGHP